GDLRVRNRGSRAKALTASAVPIMGHVVWVRLVSALVLASALSTGASGATVPEPGATATARAQAVRIVFPDGRGVGPDAAGGSGGSAVASGASYAYPASGAVVVTGSVRATGTTHGGKTARASAAAGATNVSLFNGEITADSVGAGSSASASAQTAGGSFEK